MHNFSWKTCTLTAGTHRATAPRPPPTIAAGGHLGPLQRAVLAVVTGAHHAIVPKPHTAGIAGQRDACLHTRPGHMEGPQVRGVGALLQVNLAAHRIRLGQVGKVVCVAAQDAQTQGLVGLGCQRRPRRHAAQM